MAVVLVEGITDRLAPPLLVAALEPDEPPSLVDVLVVAAGF